MLHCHLDGVFSAPGFVQDMKGMKVDKILSWVK